MRELCYVDGIPQLPAGTDDPDYEEGEVVIWRYDPVGDYWTYDTVANEQKYGYCAMAVNHFTGSRNVFLRGNATGIQNKTLMAYEPVAFFDDFNDGNYNGWSVWSGSWSAANGYLRMTPGAPATIARANTNNDLELRFNYVCNDTSDNDRYLIVGPRYNTTTGDRIFLFVKPNNITLNQRVGGVWTALGGIVLSSMQGTEYTMRVVCDGTTVEVYRSGPGEPDHKVIETSNCTVSSTLFVSFTPNTNADFNIDNVSIK